LLLELLAVIGFAMLVVVMLQLGRQLDTLIPILGLFAAAAFRLLPSVNRILNGVQSVQFALPTIDIIDREVRQLEDTPVPQRGALLMPFQKELMLSNVSFQYSGADGPALTDVSLTIPPGCSVGFVGSSGAGKSTLVDLILGLLTPGSGRITVDGVDIQSNIRGWQDQIGYVPQVIYLTDDTLRRNVAFGLNDEEIDEQAVLRAIRAAQLEDFVAGLSQGLETEVGERGVRLSGGQRQRIGIARALYHNPPVLVLDEATSSLDLATEQGVMAAVNALHGEKTVLIVAHRISTVSQCDWLYKLERGKIVQEGTFESVTAGYPAAARGNAPEA
jgi:ATP-binding cassette, subfamily B, bacterial PglK